MRDWFRRLLDTVTANLIAAGILAMLAFAGTAALAFWNSPLAPAVLTAGLGSAAFTLLLVNQVLYIVRQPRRAIVSATSGSETLSQEERQRAQSLLEFYERQRRAWRSYAHLELLRVDCAHVNEASPYVVLSLIIRNLLLVPLKLVTVRNSDGTVGAHTLPSLPENHDIQVPACQQHLFDIKLFLHGQVPDHLRAEARAECPQSLRWAFRGEWCVEVYGETEAAWTRTYEVACSSMPNVPN